MKVPHAVLLSYLSHVECVVFLMSLPGKVTDGDCNSPPSIVMASLSYTQFDGAKV